MMSERIAPPTVHLLCGYPASSKTTVARRIAERTPAVRFTLDEWMLALYDRVPDDPEYGPAADRASDLIWSIAVQCLSLRHDVVLDWSQWIRQRRTEWSSRGEKVGARVVIHYLDVHLDIALQRLADRNLERPHATHVLDIEQARSLSIGAFEPPDRGRGPGHHLER